MRAFHFLNTNLVFAMKYCGKHFIHDDLRLLTHLKRCKRPANTEQNLRFFGSKFSRLRDGNGMRINRPIASSIDRMSEGLVIVAAAFQFGPFSNRQGAKGAKTSFAISRELALAYLASLAENKLGDLASWAVERAAPAKAGGHLCRLKSALTLAFLAVFLKPGFP